MMVYFCCRHEVNSYNTPFLHNEGWYKRTEQNLLQRHWRLNHKVTLTPGILSWVCHVKLRKRKSAGF